jgi:hypothetical protein
MTIAVPFVDELLWIVSVPDAVPSTIGLNCTSSVSASRGFNVTGNAAPEMVKPVPLTDADLIVTGAFPVELRITGCVDEVLSATFPNGTLVTLTVNAGLEAFSSREKLLEIPFALAFRVTTSAEGTEGTVAVNPALVAFGRIVTVAGTVMDALLLVTFTGTPPLPAAAVNVSMQRSLPGPVMDVLPQENVLSVPDVAPA